MNTTSIKALFTDPKLLQEVRVAGWVRTFRSNRFIALNDGSTLLSLQCVVDFEAVDGDDDCLGGIIAAIIVDELNEPPGIPNMDVPGYDQIGESIVIELPGFDPIELVLEEVDVDVDVDVLVDVVVVVLLDELVVALDGSHAPMT